MSAATTSAPRTVAVGGGPGLAESLRALRAIGVEPTAIVTVADDGGSSGRLREDLGIIALGDLRRALLALAQHDALADLLDHRFARGELEGHALGNLALVALVERLGDPVAALDELAGVLRCAGRVLPCTPEPVVLHARVDGREIDGQVRVATADGCVEELWLDPRDPVACPDAVKALDEADAVVLGPGSLYTSVVANLLVPGIADALARTPARVLYVANLTSQPGETTGLDAQAHVEAVLAAVPGLRLDAVLLHDGPDGGGPGAPLGTRVDHPAVARVVRADLARRRPDGTPAHGHDPAALAAAVAGWLHG